MPTFSTGETIQNRETILHFKSLLCRTIVDASQSIITPLQITLNSDALYADYASMLYGYILKQTPDKETADRIFVSAYSYAFSHLDSFDPSYSSIFTWLLRIVQQQIKEQ